MSNNPNTVKSQDDINEGGRKSDVLLSTIEELERTKKQLECGVNRELLYLKKIEKLEKQLDRAIWWLNEIVSNHRFTPISTAEKALKEIKELNK